MQSISGLQSSIDDRRLFKYRKILQSSTPISLSMDIAERSTAVNDVAKSCFDSDRAIIPAALLCSILCALSVSALLRYRLRCRRRRVASEPEIDLVVGVKRVTGKEINIKALPTTVCDSTGSSLAGMDCPICLTKFVEGEKVRVLPGCCHSFHADCIDAWAVSNPSCPSCRHSLHHVVVEKSLGVVHPAAETTQGAQMHSNESVRENHVLQSCNSSMAASSCLDCMRSNDLERKKRRGLKSKIGKSAQEWKGRMTGI